MKLLALDTATENCSVALWLDGEIVERVELAGREHSTRLPLMVDAVLTEAGMGLRQLDGLVCGIGPGSFAGVRIGVSFVKGMALGLELPVAPVSSLAMLAQAALRETPTATVLAAIDARMGEVYAAVYQGAPNALAHRRGAEQVCPPQAFAVEGPVLPSATWIGTGTGWGAHAAALSGVIGSPLARIDPGALPRASDGLRLTVPDFARTALDANALVPAYLRNNVALTRVEQIAARAAAGLRG